MGDVRFFGHCEYCERNVTDKNGEYYVNDDGEVFCSIECVCEKYGLTKVEV